MFLALSLISSYFSNLLLGGGIAAICVALWILAATMLGKGFSGDNPLRTGCGCLMILFLFLCTTYHTFFALTYSDLKDTATSFEGMVTAAVIDMPDTAAATASLPSLGLKAFSYGKYIKVGGQLALECPKKLKEMIEKFNIQKKAIRAYKENYAQSTGKLKDASIDASKIEGLNIAEAAVLDKTTEELTAGFANASKEGEDIDDSIFDNL